MLFTNFIDFENDESIHSSGLLFGYKKKICKEQTYIGALFSYNLETKATMLPVVYQHNKYTDCTKNSIQKISTLRKSSLPAKYLFIKYF